MCVRENQFLPVNLIPVRIGERYLIPFYSYYIQASFPSPAENYLERTCDLNDLCVTNADETYTFAMNDAGLVEEWIEPGDTLIIDRSRPVNSGKLALVRLDGENLVRRIRFAHPLKVLLSANQTVAPIYVQPGADFTVIGVVTYVIRSTMPTYRAPLLIEVVLEPIIDLNVSFIQNKEATYFARVGSNSMVGDGIDRGDIIMWDASRKPTRQDIVVAWLNNEFALKRIGNQDKQPQLNSSNPTYPPIPVRKGDELRVVGVVTYVIQKK